MFVAKTLGRPVGRITKGDIVREADPVGEGWEW